MKKNLLWTLLAVGITVSAFGGYYLHKSNYFAGNNQMPENEFGETSESSEQPKAEQPREAYEWRALAWRDENGYIPHNGWSEAIRQRDEYLLQQTQQQTQRQTEKQATPEATTRLNWVSRGPQNVGGRTRSLVFHPNGTTIWAGSVSGGVWKSTDSGTSWFAMNGNLQNYAIGSMAMHPTNPDILYVGTGEGFEYRSSLRGAGIFKTTDGGMTWTQLPETRPEPPPDDLWSSVNRISIDPTDGNKILAAISGGIARSTDGGTSWTIVRPAVKSLHVAFDPMDSTKAVGEIQEGTGSDTIHRVVYSINGGLNWQNSLRDGNPFITTGLGYLNGSKRIELAFSRRPLPIINPVYALHQDGIARSDDGGANFTTKSDTALEGVSVYFNTLWVSPVNDNFVIAGGLQLHKSTDGGVMFTQITDGYIQTVQPHTDHHCVVPHPGFGVGGNKTVYVCNDGGVFRTDDITTANTNPSGGGWERKDATYQTTQYYGAAGNGTNNLIYGGTQDNGTLRLFSGNQTADLPAGADGGFAAIDPTDTGYCYGEIQRMLIHRLSNCNTPPPAPTATSIYIGIDDAGSDQMTNFIAPFILDPNEPKRMLAGGRSLWRTNDARTDNPFWRNIRQGDQDPTKKDENISAIAVKQGTINDSNFIWIGLNNGKIYRTTEGLADSPTWTPVDDNGGTNPLPTDNRKVTRILIDKDNANIVYIAFGGFSGDNLWRTNNGGTYWEDITGAGLPNVPIRVIRLFPTNFISEPRSAFSPATTPATLGMPCWTDRQMFRLTKWRL